MSMDRHIPEPWTQAQWEAITASGGNLLVSAAAGSGKTAVLVERVIHRLLETENPVDLDRFLVVTFTEAAAAEMRQRIGRALAEALTKRPGDRHLKKQQSLLNKASISTLHSFCLNLIRKYFYLLELDPSVKVAGQEETALLKEEVLEELLERKYAEADPAFFLLAETFGGRGDQGLRDQVLALYEFTRSQPWPEEWLAKALRSFRLADGVSLEKLPWYPEFCRGISLELAKAGWTLKRACRYASLPGGPALYLDNLTEELARLQELSAQLACGSWEEVRNKGLECTNFRSLPRVKADTVDAELQKKAKKERDRAKKIVQGLQSYFRRSGEELMEDLRFLAPLLENLVHLVREFSQLYQQRKKSKTQLDFADLEHYCLQLLSVKEEKAGALLPSAIALELREQYQEVLVDEYQDINDLQEVILHLVSRQGTQKPNLFMVGDVKQSIYRFRLANPLLFLKKLNSFRPEKKSRDRKIILAANFRSRETVLEGVNFLFRRLMNPEVGELTYDREAELVCRAAYPEPPEGLRIPAGSPIEVHLIERNALSEENEEEGEENTIPVEPDEDLTALEKEARLIAFRIRQMVGKEGEPEFAVWDKEIKSYRPVSYRDMAILLRSPRIRANTFLEVFREFDIPIFAQLGTGYFQAIEIHVMLSLLQVIDNPRQDIPLAAVLRSPLVGLTARELAEIRAVKKSGDFYAAVLAARQKSFNRELQEKLEKFLARLHAWRTKSRQGPLSSLIWSIYRETGYLDYVGAMPGGSQRQANLASLYERAAQFDQFARRGLFRFLRFVEKLQERDQDLGTADVLGENENVVRLISVHKSKGLEFPVVILAGLGNDFNFRDLSRDLLLHPELGFGPMVINPQLSLKYPSMAYRAVRNSLQRADLAEEMRVLYVALTRAREKLILVGSTRKLDEQRREWSAYADGDEILPAPLLASAKCYLDWLGPALAGCAEHDRRWDICCWGTAGGKALPEIPPAPVSDHLPWDRIKSLQPLEGSPQPDLRRELDRRLHWFYPLKDLTKLPAKLAVTEIPSSPITPPAEEEAVPLFRPKIKRKPLFLQGKEVFSPAQLGSLVHLVMQHLDFSRVGGEAEIERQIASLVEKGFLTEEEAAALDPRPLAGFFRRPLGLRIAAAPGEAVRRELAFTLALPAEEVYPELSGRMGGRDPVLIQGIIDCLLEEEDGMVLVDYKTDRLGEKDLAAAVARYSFQLDLYARAVETIYQLPVKERYLYFFHLGREVQVSPGAGPFRGVPAVSP